MLDRSTSGVHDVPIDAYWIEMMIADIIRSPKTIRSDALLEKLDALCYALEHALAVRFRPWPPLAH
jgi:hypothetical protein